MSVSDPFQSLRNSISFLEEKGELIRITRKVRPEFELAAVVQSIQKTINKAIYFEDVEGFDGSVTSNLCGSHQRIAYFLSCDSQSISTTWASKLRKLFEFDYHVSSTTASEMRESSVQKLPGIVIHEKDAGPYITAGIVLSRNPDVGTLNLSFHRVHLTGTEELGIRLSPSAHLLTNQRICEREDRPLECAILIGNSPLLMLAAATTISHSASELDLASHLLGRAWPLRRCYTIDLDVPEDSEIVVEGEILPNVRRNEGPFGEWMGYYTAPMPNHVFRVKAVYSRENPVYSAIATASIEDVLLQGVPLAGSILKAIDVFVPSVLDVVCWPTLRFCVIKIQKRVEKEEHKALLAALGAELNRILYAVVVDEDVDIYDPSDVLWAISNRCRPDTDIYVIPNVPSSIQDPFQRHLGRLAIDATVPLELAKEFERKKIPMSGEVSWEDYV